MHSSSSCYNDIVHSHRPSQPIYGIWPGDDRRVGVVTVTSFDTACSRLPPNNASTIIAFFNLIPQEYLNEKSPTLNDQNIRDLEGGWTDPPFKQHPVYDKINYK